MSFTTKEEFLLDLLTYYTTDTKRRCLIGTQCKYSPIGHATGSEGCAIGRHLDADLQVRLDDNECGLGVNEPTIFNQLPEWMQALGQKFLGKCQSIHDDSESWAENMLSSYGRYRVGDLVKDYNLNISDEVLNRFGRRETSIQQSQN